MSTTEAVSGQRSAVSGMPEPQDPFLTEFVPKAERDSELFWQGVTIGFALASLMLVGAASLMLP